MTLTAGMHANVNCISWETKDGDQHLDSFGSVIQASIMCVGTCDGEEVYVPLKVLIPMSVPSDFVTGSMGTSHPRIWELPCSGPILWTSICRSSSVYT